MHPQYNQPWRRHRVGKFLWTLNVALRLLLHKASAGWIPGPAILMMSQRPDLTYRSIMRRADSVTWLLRAVLLAVLGKAVLPLAKRAIW